MQHIAKITGVSERPTISQTGAPTNEVVISIETVLGATGQLVIPQREYDMLDDQELSDRIDEFGARLNKPFMLAGNG